MLLAQGHDDAPSDHALSTADRMSCHITLCHVYNNEEALLRTVVQLEVSDLLLEKSYFNGKRYIVLDFARNNVKVTYGDTMLNLNV